MHLLGWNEKKYLIGFTVMAAFVLLMFHPGAANAHVPKEISLAHDMQTQMLQATITHTNFSANHYIYKVEIRKNGNLVSLQEYKSQPSETFTYDYNIMGAAGDLIEVKAYCSRFGSRSASLTVGQSGKPAAK